MSSLFSRHAFRWPVCASLVAACIAFSQFPTWGQTKTIRLRNQAITTYPRNDAVAMAQAYSSPAPVEGLFLVQFDGQVEDAWVSELRASGVELLKYVPDDAFIAKFNNVAPDSVRALSYVRFIAPYRAEHKIHPRLASAAQAALKTNQFVAVNILLSPQATAAEIATVRALLTRVAHESRLRQGTIVSGALDPNRLDALSQLNSVLWLERAPKRKLVDELASKVVGGDDGLTGTATVSQQLGFTGAGVTVCVADTGLDTGITNTMHPDVRGRVSGFLYYGDVLDGSDGYGHGTHCAGIVAGNAATLEKDPATGAWYGLGVASGANLLIERIFDDYAIPANPFPSDETLTHDAVRNGAQIGSNSWGNDVQGEYDTDAAQFDELVRDADAGTPGDQPYILEFSSGNAGANSQTVGSPATGKNVLTTGASENVPGTLALTYGLYADGVDTMADFSSRGPCEDGRIKPDVVAPGTWIASMASSAATDEASIAWTVIDHYYVYMGGTSMSGPHAAGAAAVFVQYYKSRFNNVVPSPALVKAALINSSVELDELNGGPGPIPNNDEGWGRIYLPNLIITNTLTSPRTYEFVDQSTLLTNGQVYVHHTLVRSSGQPLKITLAYTDVPGFPGAIPALVNDLDLEVVGPDGTLYRGNRFTGGESIPNAPSPDSLNNVEAVHLAQPLPGDYLVRVRARRVVQDARLDTAIIDQDFALAVSGDLARADSGSVLLDRPSYTAPSAIRLQVLDAARAASNTVSVLVKSTTEPSGENYLLHASGNYGAFTGAVATVVGNASADAKLEIHNGDLIEVDYVDSSGAMRVGQAVGDLVPPTVTGVAATVDLGVIAVTWQTSEPANSIVRYSTNLSFNLSATNAALATSHLLKLSHLIPGATYHFFVTSSDVAGNTTTNNNSGANYNFIGVATPTVLMVDAFEPADGSPDIPDTSYTSALALAGYSYAVWKVLDRGSPQLMDIQPYPVLIWRTTDDIVNYEGTNNTLTPQEQYLVQTYLDQGGSFFMSSMGILTQLGNVAFRKEVFHVGRFLQNPDAPSQCADCDEDFEVPAFVGALGDPITSGMAVTLDYTNYPYFDLDDIVYGPDFSDTFTPTADASTIAYEMSSGKPCGMSYPRPGQDSPGRVVFLSFPIDTVHANDPAPNNEVVLMQKILKFLAPGANGLGTVILDSPAYTIPSQVTIEVGDSDLLGLGQTQVTVSTSSSTNRVTVTLNASTHPGLFRGFITLVGANATTNQLKVLNGDTITATYLDASRGSNVIATATVDTVAPVISGVAAVTGFGDAVVSWTTSKPADSLVQYGESLLINRTAYDGRLMTNHAITLSGLLANRNYFFTVASTDIAGNTTIDDNQGTNYMFTTKPAPQPPWFDDLEHGSSGWKVLADTTYGSEVNWSLGTPHNLLQNSAHSGTNAWGSNLTNKEVSFIASSFLFSPFVDLSRVSTATLSFWHCYDFSSPFEVGQLGISTNSSTPPASIPTYVDYGGDTSTDWTYETVDLTPYVGQTIQVVWYYQGVTIGDPLKGWLVDDVGITGTALGAGGTITISKNLSQGTFTLTGLINRSGTGLLNTISNAPPGDYTVDFTDVTFYQTPAEVSRTLSAGGTIKFTGNYSFIDANRNGISDAWERFYFGSATTNRTQVTDTDADGMPDYAEFIAGTNPTNAASKLIMLGTTFLSNRVVRIDWAAIPGRAYQAQTSTNPPNWTPITDWIQATGSPMSCTTTNPGTGSHLYRVQVRP